MYEQRRYVNRQNRNYQKELDEILGQPRTKGKRLLLHSCCAPCSSYCMEYLREYFALTVFYYNPNITEEEEYRRRAAEEKRLVEAYNRQITEAGRNETVPKTEDVLSAEGVLLKKTAAHSRLIQLIEGDYEPAHFYEIAKGLEQCPEGGERCFRCYELRLRKTAELAKIQNFDYFTTTLTISPLKNAHKLNEIGERLWEEYGVAYLPSDFKKRDGYKRSIELSREYGLYRQDYCGCVFSKVNAVQ